jgi:hypothetical protein
MEACQHLVSRVIGEQFATAKRYTQYRIRGAVGLGSDLEGRTPACTALVAKPAPRLRRSNLWDRSRRDRSIRVKARGSLEGERTDALMG